MSCACVCACVCPHVWLYWQLKAFQKFKPIYRPLALCAASTAANCQPGDWQLCIDGRDLLTERRRTKQKETITEVQRRQSAGAAEGGRVSRSQVTEEELGSKFLTSGSHHLKQHQDNLLGSSLELMWRPMWAWQWCLLVIYYQPLSFRSMSQFTTLKWLYLHYRGCVCMCVWDTCGRLYTSKTT